MRLSMELRQLAPQRLLRRRLPFPATPSLRAGQVTTTSTFDGVVPFGRDRWEELETFRPRILVGPSADLQAVAEQMAQGWLELSSVDHAVFVLTRSGERPLNDVARVVLWQAFGVPVYEVFLGPAGTLLAAECEAHEGWHVEPNAKFFCLHDELLCESRGGTRIRTGLRGRITTELCPCGRAGGRIVDVDSVESDSAVHRLAATA